MLKIILIVFFIFLLATFSVYPYDNEITHRDITKNAVENSDTNTYLKNNIGVENGIETKINGKSILQLLREGSYLEDSPMCRASNHFHNPLKPWNESYVTDQPLWIEKWCDWTTDYSTKYSNITWATDFQSRGGNKISPANQAMGWGNARGYYYLALTSPSSYSREEEFVKTFQALGQVIHLLEDVSVPAHVRNDFTSHLKFNKADSLNPTEWFIQPYENYVKNNPTLVATASATLPSFTDQYVTDFWDTEQYNGSNPSTDLSIGLAEFTNANYFSDETIPNNNPSPEHTFTYPQVTINNTHICEDVVPGSTDISKYISRNDRAGCDHFATASFLNADGLITNDNIPNLKLWLDDNVHDTYATELLPRAVGYSAGLLNYFFRGDIDLISEGGGYVITNNSAEDMEGMFELYQEDSNGVRTRIWNGQLILGPSGSGNHSSGNVNFPGTAGKYTLVFSGRLGNEYGAVVGRLIELYWLDIISPGNGTITSSDGGINCGSNCSRDYLKGTAITLTAVANPGWSFSGWSAAECPGTGDCVITLNKDTALTPSFSAHLTWTAEPVSYPRYRGYVGINGGHTSIAVDSLNRVHIGYYFADPIDRNLREDYYHAVKVNGSWSGDLLGGYSNVEYTGQYSSMTVDSSDNVYTTFLKYLYNYSLMYATNAPSGAWNYASINGSASFGQTSIKTDSSGYVHISFSGSGQKYMTNAPSGSWVSTAIDSNSLSNNYSSIAVDSFDKPHISFNSTGGLWHAVQNDQGTWSKEKIDNTGTYTSIVIDSLDNVHISYFSGSALKYATNKDVVPGYGNCPGNTNWNCAVVDSSGGAYTSIALDSSGRVHISYNAGGYLKHAYGSYGLWNMEAVYTIASNSNTSIAVDSSNVIHISYKNTSYQLIHAFANLP